MERYRLIPHEKGIAIAVPLEHAHLVDKIRPELAIVASWETPFIANSSRWGLSGILIREEQKDATLYIGDFSRTPVWKITASLNLLFLALNYENEESDPLITIEGLLAQGGASGYDMSARLLEKTVRVTRTFGASEHQKVAHAMKRTARTLNVNVTDYTFVCSTTSSLGLSISGDYTYLSGDWSERVEVATLTGHNIHSFWMQAAFLTGLAEVQLLVEEQLSSS